MAKRVFTDESLTALVNEIKTGDSELQNQLDNKMEKENPTGTGSFSLNRLAESEIGDDSFTAGYDNTASGPRSHAEGLSTIASGSNSHAEGLQTKAYGDQSHAEGDETQSDGVASHAEGQETSASGDFSHAEGMQTQAVGQSSHAEGEYTIADGSCAHSEGEETMAAGSCSHSEGAYTIANGDYQHVQGKYNIEDDNNTYAHIVGNGTGETSRSNAHTLDWDGNAWFAGDVKVGGTNYDDGSKLVTGLSDLDITATASELNFTDGVTSNIQTQLDTKVPTSRTVNGKALTGNISLTASDVGATSYSTATISIATSNWSSKTATISCSIATASNTLIIAPAPASYGTWGTCKIRATAQAAGKITFACDTTPSAAVSVNVIALG